MASRKRQTAKTIAKDAEGRAYTVIVMTTFLDTSGFGSARKEIAASEEYFTSVEEDGIRVSKPVKRISKGVYEIVGTGVEIRSDAPDAP